MLTEQIRQTIGLTIGAWEAEVRRGIAHFDRLRRDAGSKRKSQQTELCQSA